MSIFNLHSNALADYRDFVRSFFTMADDRAREFIERELAAPAASIAPGQPRLRPRLDCGQTGRARHVAPGKSANFPQRLGRAVLSPQHQVEAMDKAGRGEATS